jgi:hypothetical protein
MIPARTVLFLTIVFSGAAFGSDDYVTIKDGHLSCQGKRLRIWSSMGNFVAADYAHIDGEVQRFADLGFNGYRTSTWWDIDIDKWTYKKGDNSLPDLRDYLLAALRKRGIRVWADMLNSALVRPEHVDLVDRRPGPHGSKPWAINLLIGGMWSFGINGPKRDIFRKSKSC